MTDEIKLEPVEEKEEKQPEWLLPETLTEKTAQYVNEQIQARLNTYYSINQIEETPLPKEAKWHLNEIMLLLKEFDIIVLTK